MRALLLILMMTGPAFGQAFTLRDPGTLAVLGFGPPGTNITFSAGGSYNNTANQLTYTNGAAVIPANTLALLSVQGSTNATYCNPTNVTGNGCTWVKVGETNYNSGAMGISVWRTMTNATTASGSPIAAFARAQRGCNMYLALFTNVNVTGTSGSGAVVQFAASTNATANPVITLSALESDKSATYLAMGNVDQNGAAGVPEGSGVEDFDNGYTTTSSGLYVCHTINTTDNTVGVTQGAQQWGAIAIEIKQ
jgi:hypothetical protein